MFDSGEGGDGDALDGEVEGVDGGGTEECQVEVETEWLVAGGGGDGVTGGGVEGVAGGRAEGVAGGSAEGVAGEGGMGD